MVLWLDGVRQKIASEKSINSLSVNASGNLVAFSDYTTVKLLDPAEGHPQPTLENGQYQALALSADGCWLLVTGSQNKFSLWNLKERLLHRSFLGGYGGIYSIYGVALDMERDIAATGCDDRVVRLWQLSTGRCRAVLDGHRREPSSVDFSLDGWTILTAAVQGMHLWSCLTGTKLRDFEPITSQHLCVRLSPDGNLALSAASDGIVRVYHVPTGRCLHELSGHEGSARAVCWSGSGRYAISSGADGMLRYWELDYA